MASASDYAVLGITHPGELQAPELVALLAEWSFVPVFAALIFMLLLFPSGTLPSPRWRPFAVLVLLATALALAGFVVHPRLIALPAPGGESLMVANPLGIQSLGPVLWTRLDRDPQQLGCGDHRAAQRRPPYPWPCATGRADAKCASRSSGSWWRRWCSPSAQLAALLGIAATGTAANPVTTVSFAVVPIVALLGISALITVAILKHGLYQIDVIINRAIRYGLLSAALTAIYVLHRGGDRDDGRVRGRAAAQRRGGAGDRGAVPAAAAPGPAAWANRIVYGQRATPYQVLVRLRAGHGGRTGCRRRDGKRMASVFAAAAARAGWRAGWGSAKPLRPQAAWPHGSTPSAPVPLGAAPTCCRPSTRRRGRSRVAGDELLGAITVAEAEERDGVGRGGQSFLEHLASQAGLVLRNVRLTAELQARHRRPVGIAAAAGAGPRTPSGIGSSGTCTTALSSSSSRSTSSSPCWRAPPTSPSHHAADHRRPQDRAARRPG